MTTTIFRNQPPICMVLSATSYRVYSVLNRNNRAISLSSLASILHKSIRSIKRAINEIQQKGLWSVKFQILTDILVKDSIYILTDNTLDNILSCKKRNNDPTGKNSACVDRRMKGRIKEYLVSLLTKDEKKLRYWCRELGYSVNDSMDKEDLLILLHDDYLVRFVKYHMTKVGTAFLDKTEKEFVKIFGYWLRTFKKGCRPNYKDVQKELKEEVDRVFPDVDNSQNEDTELDAELYEEVKKIDMEEVNKNLAASLVSHNNLG